MYVNKDSSRELCFDVCYKINWKWGIFQSNTKCCQSKMSTHIHEWKSSKMNCILSWWGLNNRKKGTIPWKVNRYLMKSRPLNIGVMLKKGCNEGAKIWRDIVPLFFLSVCGTIEDKNYLPFIKFCRGVNSFNWNSWVWFTFCEFQADFDSLFEKCCELN